MLPRQRWTATVRSLGRLAITALSSAAYACGSSFGSSPRSLACARSCGSPGYAWMSMAFRPPRKWTIVGDGTVTLGVFVATDFQELEVVPLDVFDVPKFAGDDDARRREVDLTGVRVELRGDAAGDRHALQPLQEVGMEERPPVLAVGDAAQTGGFLLRHEVADRVVLRGAQLRLCDLVFVKPRPRVQQASRAEQA